MMAIVNYTALTDLLSFTADAGEADNVTVTSPAANMVRIVVGGGDTISLAGDASFPAFTLTGGSQLDIDTSLAPAANFNVNLGDLGDTLTFGLANPSNGVTNVNLQGDAGTDTVTLNALTITGNLTVASETINLGGIVTASGNVTLTAVNSLTDGADNDIADIVGGVVSLTVTGASNMIGAGAADFLEVDAATQLNAATNNGLIALKNVSGNLPLGTMDAGTNFIFLTARNGAITDANGTNVNLAAANGVSLSTTGSSSAIGAVGDAIETAIGALTATTNDGGIYIADSNGPGLIINSVLAKEGGQTPFVNGSNQIVLNSGNTLGTHDVSITAQGDILLNTVIAPEVATITSVAGRILDINQGSNNILARSHNLVASGIIGQDGDAIESTVEAFSASTTNGSIFLVPLLTGTAVSVIAGGAGNDVSIAGAVPSLRIQTISAPGDVTVANASGLLLDANGATVNITAQVVSLTGSSGIGTAADPLDTNTSDLRTTASDAAAPIFVNEADGLTSVSAKTNAGRVLINFTGGPLTFDPSTQLLSLSGTAALTFETTTGDIKLGVVDAGVSNISITADGAILDNVNDAVVDLRGGTVTLQASTGIGAVANTIDTDVTALSATTTSGGVFIREANSITVSASTTTGDIDVRTATGNMTVGLVSASSQVTLQSGGAILDGNAANNNVAGTTLVLVASNGIGSGGDALETLVDSVSANGGTGGGLLIANTKPLTVTSATATGGAVNISAIGSMTLTGDVIATGQDATLSTTGPLIDANAGNDITADSVTLKASKIGVSGNKLETTTAALTATTTAGGIFLSNTGATLALNATAAGAAADIDLDTTGSIVLGVATAKGDTVKLLAVGSITDGNDPPITVNVTARKIDITAPGGIGTALDAVEMDVDVVIAADGGAAGAFITFTGPLLLTESALQAAGAGTLTFDAESITIEDIADNTATLAAGRSLVLRTPAGWIVFLDAADTIEASGAGTITVQAGANAGIGELAVAVLGNLKTAGGNILVEADRTITIGMLDAGAGDVTVKSETSIIIDGNGPALNIIAGSTTLSGAGRTDREAELDETFRIAEAAANAAEASADQTTADAFASQLAMHVTYVQTLQATVANEEVVYAAANAAAEEAQNNYNIIITAKEASDTALAIASVAASAALLIMGPAQAVPLVGDAGAATAWAALQITFQSIGVANNALALAAAAYAFEVTRLNSVAATAQAQLAADTSSLNLALALQDGLAEAGSITQSDAAKAAIVRDASARIRDQAILARDQANVIGTFAEPLGIQVTGVINVTAGPTDSYLQVVGTTALDLIQTTGSVTLISTGIITDADAGAGSDILGTGLRIIAVGGIGSAADPIETRVAVLNAANTSGGDIAIANVVGTPAALDITGISNVGGGDVIISNAGNTAAGQGITVSGPISAAGAGAGITIASGSPLTISADLTSAAGILLTASESAAAGDDLTVNSGVTLESTGSSVELRAGDNILVAAGSTIKAATTITMTADFNDVDATGANVVVAGALVATSALITVDPAANDNDTFTITPSIGAPITVDAEDGTDTLNFIADGLAVTILGNVITAAGLAPVTFLNFEFVNIINTNGGGSIMLNTAAGAADALILTGTAQKAGTFTLNGGIPISFTGVDSFNFNAGDIADNATVTPFATPVLPWNVAVKIDGGTGTADRIIYNNVVGLRDTTSVTAAGPQAGHIDSPGVTSALHSQLITFTNVEDLTVNANPGEDERLTVNLRDSGAPDTANLLFDPTPGNDDLQLVGLFDMVIDTDDYVGLTLNGRDGNDTFNVTPGPLPVFIDGGNPIGSTAGDKINFFPTGAYIIEPGPENDAGGFNAVGGQRISWDQVEEISVTGGTGIFLGTNGDDDITIIARDSFTHAAADGVQDFTVSLNAGPSILFVNTPTFYVDALAGDDDIVMRTPAPNNAVWDVNVFIAGGQPAAPTGLGQQGDVFELETPGTQSVSFSPTGIGTATIDIVTLSSVITIAPFTSPVSGLPSSSGGVEQIVYQGLGGNDPLTINGTPGSDVATINSNGTGTLLALLSPDFDFSGAGPIIVNGGLGTDRVIYNGTIANDVIDSQQTAATVVSTTVNGLTHTANGTEIIGINTLSGDDLIRIGVIDALQIANPAASNRFDVDAGDANARLIVQDLGLGDLDIQRQGSDGRSGSITIGRFNPVVYKNLRRVDITPLNSITGGTGTDGSGRIVIFPSDPFESNESRLNAGQLARVSQNSTSPSIDPGAATTPFEVNGDEDWYEFRPQATGTFAVKILFDKIANLPNGRPGLPGDGDLSLEIYDANGILITNGVANAAGTSKTATFGATNDSASPQFNRIYVRVRGATPNSINLYDFDSLDGVGSVNPGVGNADLFGPQVTNIQVNSVPSATYNLFNSKDADNALHPTPLTNSLLISFRDLPQRAPGFVYPALDPITATTPGTYVLRGDASGIIAISSIIIEPGTNQPPGVGGLATGQVRLVFANPLPDDRFTLTINDTLLDPAGNKLDGESNAAEPNGGPQFPSGNTQAGGNFVARFTIDTRVELGTYASGSVYVDTNGNYSFDPTNTDATNRDITYLMGFTSDNIFAGNFVKAQAGIADGFDKLAAYGKVGTNYRWIIDVNNDGIVNALDVNVIQPLFAGVTNIGGTPVAGNFDGNAANGDEVALKVGTTWLLDKVGHNFVLETKLPGTNMIGLPIVGDFDNDGIDDLGSWADDKFYLNLSTLGPIDGTADKTFTFGFASVRERPVAGDFDGDGITDLGLWVPDRAGVAPAESAEWYLLLSGGTAVGRGGIAGQGQTILDRLNAPGGVVFTPAPFGNDRFAQFGDEYGLPIPGNFDPPITSAQPTDGFTNTQLNLDVNNDGLVTAFDALAIINRLNLGNTALTNTPFTPKLFVDVNSDGIVSAFDALAIINWLNTNPVGDAVSGAGEAVNTDSVFAELGDDAGAEDIMLALLAGDVNGGRKVQRSTGPKVGR